MDQTQLAWSVPHASPRPTGPAEVLPHTDDAEQAAFAGATRARTGPAAARGLCPQAQTDVPEQLTGRVRTWYLRAAEHHNSGRPDRAVDLLVSAVRAEPCLGCLREALARAQYDAGQYLAARTTFMAMTAIDPVNHFALFGLGLAETRLGAHAASVRHLERAVRLYPGDQRYSVALEQANAALERAGREGVGCNGAGDRSGAVRAGKAAVGRACAAAAGLGPW